jgi:two-component system C4-dicarboxylate transport sensor histidine kinase DctB
MTDASPASPRLRRSIKVLVLCVAVALALSVAALPKAERYFLTQAGLSSDATLRLATEVLRGSLSRAEALPSLLAERPILRTLLRDPTNSGVLPFSNEQLRQTALALDVADVYVMDPSGLTIAASSYRTDRSFIGRNFNYRPYFTQALAGGTGRFHALGTTSGERGYFFAAPVIEDTDIVGVVAVKITMDRFEDTWRDGGADLIVTDSSNVVFMSSRQDWLFRTLGVVNEAMLERIAETRQFPLDRLTPLPQQRVPLTDDLDLITLTSKGIQSEYITGLRLIAAAGWRVSILTPTGPARAQAQLTLTVAVLAILLTGMLGAVVLQRRHRLLERLEDQRETQALLEQRVAERTADLKAEVAERTATAQQLRRTQTELVQAGKLAALGQMSAALSHEFNQPLAAVKAYADNAATFLDRGRADEARKNVSHISDMADRMASISKHLRNFARRPQEKIGPIPLFPVIEDAVALMAPRLSAAQATIEFTPAEGQPWVMGGRVRLQQVIVNLLSNALDALGGRTELPITIATTQTETGWQIAVRDHGPGFEADALSKVFDPFFTTKEPGQGLGLGLSVSYNIIKDFGGTLLARTHPEGGAEFTIDLVTAGAPETAPL